jgi:cell division septum initiation protein DivIVA
LGETTVTEKDLKKLNRYQLLELLIIQTERADKLQLKLEETEKQLNEKELKMTSLGSIAEASLQLGGVFQATQAAADLYIEAAKKKADEIEKAAHKKAAEILDQAQTYRNKSEG